MQGHIRRRGKQWTIVLVVGYTHAHDPAIGKPIRKKIQKWIGGFKTRRDAEVRCAQLLADWHAGTWTPPTKITTREFLELWLERYAKGAVGPVTFANYTKMIRRSIIPALGPLPLSRLGPQALQGYYGALCERTVRRRCEGRLEVVPIRMATAHAHHRLLRTALGHAVRWGLIARNPAALTNPPRPQRRQVAVWDTEQVQLFLGVAKRTSPHYPLYLTAILTGMRLGELLGFRWQDVNLVMRTVTIRQTFYRLGRRQLFKSPKTTGSERTVQLSDAVVEALRTVRDAQQQIRTMVADESGGLDLVFCQPNGKPLHGHNLTQRDFRRVIAQAGLPLIRFHDLRHAHASYLALAGVPLKVAQERLGHATPTFTARVYQHVLSGQQEAAAEAVEALLLRRREGES
jgi:integrase